MAFAIITAALLQAAAPAPECSVNVGAAMALSFDAFDQGKTTGWRPLGDKPGCETAAADLIKYYRQTMIERISLLYWHEAQLRALAGQSADAIALMEQSRKPAGEDPFGWNPYVDASVAFLRNDRPGLEAARARLQALPRLPDWPAGSPWPMNGEVVDGLLACFGQGYAKAYGGACRPAKATTR